MLRTVEFKGDIVSALHIQGDLTSTVVRRYTAPWLAQTYEIESFVDSIPVHDFIGKEVVLLVDTKINNGDTFFTDSNGLEL